MLADDLDQHECVADLEDADEDIVLEIAVIPCERPRRRPSTRIAMVGFVGAAAVAAALVLWMAHDDRPPSPSEDLIPTIVGHLAPAEPPREAEAVENLAKPRRKREARPCLCIQGDDPLGGP